MSKPDKRLIFILLALLIIIALSSCDSGFLNQIENKDIPFSQTSLFLTPERLPTPPPGMVYELWVSNKVLTGNSVTAQDVVSLGRFSYIANDTLIAFIAIDSTIDTTIDTSLTPWDTTIIITPDSAFTPRVDSNQFVIDGDLFSYKQVLVSVEHFNDSFPDLPGPIMLIDRIVGQVDFKPKMTFPLSEDLWNAAVLFNFEAVSDNNRNLNDGKGVWFSSYRIDTAEVQDTTRYDITFDSSEIIPEFPIDTTVDTIIDSFPTPWDTTITTTIDTNRNDTLNLDTIHGIYLYDVLNIVIDTTYLVFRDSLILGLDSVRHIGAKFDKVFQADTIAPFYVRNFTVDMDTSGVSIIILDVFTQGGLNVPDYTAWGWQYEGWVVSSALDTTGTSLSVLTPPAWEFSTPARDWIPGHNGGMVSTGTFSDMSRPDNSDAFTFSLFVGTITRLDTNSLTGDTATVIDSVFKKPRFPGEDFLNNTALNSTYGINPSVIDFQNASQPSTVLISLEPTNRLTTKTNFPLIAFLGEALSVFPNTHGRMRNKTDALVSFPKIKVDFDRRQ